MVINAYSGMVSINRTPVLKTLYNVFCFILKLNVSSDVFNNHSKCQV